MGTEAEDLDLEEVMDFVGTVLPVIVAAVATTCRVLFLLNHHLQLKKQPPIILSKRRDLEEAIRHFGLYHLNALSVEKYGKRVLENDSSREITARCKKAYFKIKIFKYS